MMNASKYFTIKFHDHEAMPLTQQQAVSLTAMPLMLSACPDYSSRYAISSSTLNIIVSINLIHAFIHQN